jgi:hypothetical protein
MHSICPKCNRTWDELTKRNGVDFVQDCFRCTECGMQLEYMLDQIIVENLDYISELDGKNYYFRRIILPKRIEESDRWIEFNKPLSFTCHHIDETTTENPRKIAYIEFDFGMQTQINLLVQNNFILKNMSKDLTDEELMARDVIFDLFHAFHHTNVDPNYYHYHWALYGNLKDRVIIGEKK